jgi:hypothetical protein
MAFDPLNMSPYGWIPDAWAQPAPMQPGLGIPQSTVDAAAPQIQQDAEIEMPGYPPEQPEIEMANMDMRPNIGFPRLVEDAPAELPAPMPADEPLPEVDAISGVGAVIPPPPSDMQPGGLQPGLGIPMAAFDAAADFAARPPDWRSAGDNALEVPEDIDQVNAAAYAKMTPEDRANAQFDLAQRREAEERSRMTKAAIDNAEAIENEHRAHLESRAKAAQDRQALEMDAKKLAETNIDPEKWWNDRSTGQKVAAFIAAIAGGLVQPHGGRNSGLAAIDTMIDRDIDAQKANMANKRAELQRRGGALNDAAATEAEDYREQTMFRVASYERIKTQISTEMQNFDPRGTSRIKLGEIYVGIEGQRQAALASMQDKRQKQLMEAIKVDQEQQKIDIDRAKMEAAAQAALLKARGGGAKAVKPDDVVHPRQWYADQGLPVPPDDKSVKEYKTWQGLTKTGQEIKTNASTQSREELERGIPGLKNGDGSAFIAKGTPESIVALRAMKSGTQTAVRLMDEALRVRTGWSSNTGNSDERKKLKAIWGQAKLAAKDTFKLGAITEADVPLIEGALGTDDPSTWTDPEAGIMTARRLLLNRANTEFEGAGYEGSRWDIKAPTTRAAVETADDAAFKKAQDENVGSITTFIADEENLDPAKRGAKKSFRDNEAAWKQAGGIPPSIAANIAKWTSEARGSDEAKSKIARGYLAELTTTGGNDAVKAAARAAIEEANQTPSTDTFGAPSTSVARETVPPLPTKKKGKR